nr:GPN-loop GTPase 3-like [Tanacetum cinerariifolium]
MDVEDYRIEEEEEKEESIDYEYENEAIKFEKEEMEDLEEVTSLLLIAQVCTNCKANLDPAAENFNYPLAMDIHELISLKDVMDELKLGPTDGLVYCMEHFKENLDEWLSEELDNYMEDDYLVFDCQIELFFHVPALKSFVEHLRHKNFTVCVVYMLDSQLPESNA